MTGPEAIAAAERLLKDIRVPTGTDAGVAELVADLQGMLAVPGGVAIQMSTAIARSLLAALAQQATQLQEARRERDAAHAHACENSLEERNLRAQLTSLRAELEEAEAQLVACDLRAVTRQELLIRGFGESQITVITQEALAEVYPKLSEAAWTALALLHRATTAEGALEVAEAALAEARRARDEAKAKT